MRVIVLLLLTSLAACGPGVEEGPLPDMARDAARDAARDTRSTRDKTTPDQRRDTRHGEASPCICDNNYNHYMAHRLYYCNPPTNTKLCAAGSNEELPGQLNIYDKNCLRELTPGYFKTC